MALKTYTEQLESVQTAIASVEATGQGFDVNGRTVTRGDLRTLYQRERWLRSQVAREARGGIRMRQVVPRG